MAVERIPAPRIEAAPLCPWRQPGADLGAWFPDATGYRTETRILSGQRLALTDRLGRTPGAEENALRVYRVERGDAAEGVVLTKRVKGEWGAIEIVLAVNPDGRVRGLRLQRLREPEVVRDQLQRPDWLGAFVGRGLTSEWRLDGSAPPVVPEAQTSAAAVREGIQCLLVLYRTSEEAGVPVVRHEH